MKNIELKLFRILNRVVFIPILPSVPAFQTQFKLSQFKYYYILAKSNFWFKAKLKSFLNTYNVEAPSKPIEIYSGKLKMKDAALDKYKNACRRKNRSTNEMLGKLKTCSPHDLNKPIQELKILIDVEKSGNKEII